MPPSGRLESVFSLSIWNEVLLTVEISIHLFSVASTLDINYCRVMKTTVIITLQTSHGLQGYCNSTFNNNE